MEEAHLAVLPGYIANGDFTDATGERAMRELMNLAQPPTAVLACNDLMALGCLVAAKKMGFRVPNDVAVVGFDDIPEAARVCPELTTISQQTREMGTRLAEALFERIEGKVTGPARRFEISCELIVRESA
jgi:LacI family transcriptional regulator